MFYIYLKIWQSISIINANHSWVVSLQYTGDLHPFFSSSFSSIVASMQIETLLPFDFFFGSGTEYLLYKAYSSTSSGQTSITCKRTFNCIISIALLVIHSHLRQRASNCKYNWKSYQAMVKTKHADQKEDLEERETDIRFWGWKQNKGQHSWQATIEDSRANLGKCSCNPLVPECIHVRICLYLGLINELHCDQYSALLTLQLYYLEMSP